MLSIIKIDLLIPAAYPLLPIKKQAQYAQTNEGMPSPFTRKLEHFNSEKILQIQTTVFIKCCE
jgi:hypothetical protein